MNWKKIVFVVLVAWFLSGQKVFAKTEQWGFLPNWRLNNNPRVDLVDKLFFFSVPVAGNGSLKWDFASKRIYGQTFKNQAAVVIKRGGKVGVVFAMLRDKDLDKFLMDKSAWETFFREASKLEKEVGANMFNIDFEYQKSPTAILNDNYFEFLTALRSRLGGELSVDVFGNTLYRGEEEKIKRLFEKTDRVIFMAYDFYDTGLAGPVAPLAGKAGVDLENVFERVNQLAIDRGRLVVALPLYGYEWRTRTSEFGSVLHPKSIRMLASLGRMEDFLKNNSKIKLNYDEVTETPWLTYKVGTQIRQIYFENERSLKAKIVRVEKYGYGGVAWWALGYEGKFGDKLQKLIQ